MKHYAVTQTPAFVLTTAMILANPLYWLDLIHEHRVTHTWSPNFGLKLVNDALAKSQEMAQEEMGKVTGGLNIPGMF